LHGALSISPLIPLETDDAGEPELAAVETAGERRRKDSPPGFIGF